MAESAQITHQELHLLRGGEWNFYRTLELGENPSEAAEQVLANGGVAGVRVARFERYVGADLNCLTITHRVFPPDRSDPDPALVAHRPGQEPCQVVADFYAGPARDDARGLLVKLLEQLKVTLTEALYVGSVARQVDAVPMAVTAMLQKIAIAQTKGTKDSAQARVRDLTALATALVAQIDILDEKEPVPALPAAEHFPQMAAALRSRIADAALFEFTLSRVLATAMPRQGDWLHKLAFLTEAYSAELDPIALRVIDHLLADILAMPSSIVELQGSGAGRAAALRMIAELSGGQWAVESGAPGASFAAGLNRLLQDPALLRSRWVLRQRLFRELSARGLLTIHGDIVDEAEALAELRRRIRKVSRVLARDEDIRYVLEWRIERLLARDRLDEMLGARPDPLDRIEALCRLLAAAMGQGNKLAVIGLLREQWPRLREAAKGPDSAPKLARSLRLLHDESVPSDAKAEFAVPLDGILAGGLRSRIQLGRQRAPVDLMFALVRLLPLPEGASVRMIRDAATELARQPGFLEALVERAGSDEARNSIMARMHALLSVEMG